MLIISDEYSEGAKSLAALTGIERDQWYEVRKSHFASGVNKESLDVIESSAFHVSRDYHKNSNQRSHASYK